MTDKLHDALYTSNNEKNSLFCRLGTRRLDTRLIMNQQFKIH